MKVILNDYVEHLGERGDTVHVKPGYGRNYLIPKGLAYPDTPGNRKLFAQEQRRWEDLDLGRRSAAEKVAEGLAGTELVFERRAGEKDVLFGSVSALDIVRELVERGVEVEKRRVQLDEAIKAVRPDAQVLTQALAPFAGPYSAGSTCGFSHEANPLNWVQYMRRMLDAIRASGGIDGIALHINSRGYRQEDIHSTQKVTAGGQSLYFSFYVYKDWVDHGIPPELYHLPLYATEANGIYYWNGGHPERPDSHYESGWVQEVYAEIDRYNRQAAASGKPVFRAVNLYRWCAWCDGWNIDSSPYEGQILGDLDQAVAAQYRWPTGDVPPPPPPPGPPPPPPKSGTPAR